MNVFADKLFNILDNSIPSPPVSPIASPMAVGSTQPYTNHLIKDPYTIEPGNLVSYNMGRGSTKREVVARVISVSDSRKSIRTEDGSIVGGEFIPSGIRISGNPTVVLIQDTKLFKVIVNTKYTASIETSEPISSLKKTSKKNSKLPNADWIIKGDDILRYKEHSNLFQKKGTDCHESKANTFLAKIYRDENYIQQFTVGSKLKKRGANAKNWKENGEYICPSLHKIDNVYQSIGQTGEGLKKSKFANTWPTSTGKSPIPPAQCKQITKFSGEQCKRSSYNSPCGYCTQHFKMSIKKK
jgi:hypothetical protein